MDFENNTANSSVSYIPNACCSSMRGYSHTNGHARKSMARLDPIFSTHQFHVHIGIIAGACASFRCVPHALRQLSNNRLNGSIPSQFGSNLESMCVAFLICKNRLVQYILWRRFTPYVHRLPFWRVSTCCTVIPRKLRILNMGPSGSRTSRACAFAHSFEYRV